jgi:Uma2 family endonuclease
MALFSELTMSTATRVSLEEYPATSYRPDREFLDEEVLRRHVGEFMRGALQSRFGFVFTLNTTAWSIKASTEQRLRLATNRFRIPDVCVFEANQIIAAVPATPPLLCIEILSKDDSVHAGRH